MGYSDVQQMIIATLMGRDPGTEIQPENHQEYALALLDYARSIELAGASALMGVATVATIPVQPNEGSVFYLANLASGTTYTFSNFYDSSGNAIQITTSTAEVGFATLIWNTVSWSSEVTTYTFNEEECLKEIATKFDQLEQNSYINGYVAGRDGSFVASSEYRTSGMLAFDRNFGVTSYSSEMLAGDSVAAIAFYNAEGTYLSGVPQTTQTVSVAMNNINTDAVYVVHSYKVSSTSHSFSYKAPQILQGLGDSKTAPISQKAATESFLTPYSEELQDVLAYGIQFDTTVSSPTCTRLGSSTLHKTLPIQSGMRGCLLNDDGEVTTYFITDGSWVGYNRDGSQGQVMVEIPEHYRKFVTDGTVRQVWLSEYPIEGYTKVPTMYVSAYEASVNRTTTTLASVVNLDADYRGGGNNTAYDDTYRSFLGRPATNISLTNFRTYARNRKENSTEWNCMTYEAHKTIFWLFVTEYATLNSQADINAELTSDGYKQGGLGDGPTTLSSANWSNFNGSYPFIPCGHTDSLGNGTGQVLYEAFDEGNDVTISTYANRYRGVENPFGHIWQWTDGILVDIRTDDYAGDYAGQSRVMVAPETASFASPTALADSYEGYEFRGLQARTSSSYIKEIIFGNYGDMLGEVVGGSSTTFFCDYNYTSVTSSSIRGVRFGGSADYGSSAGFACSSSATSPSGPGAAVGSRLCFHPAEN